MASLVGQQLKDTYDSLLKTSDNDALGVTYKEITDGSGNGSNLYLGTGGNVGIGTSSPGANLEIKATSVPVIRLNQADTYYAPIKLAGNDLEIRGSSGRIEFYNGANDGDSSTEKMCIDSSGRVGINNSSPPATLSVESLAGNSTVGFFKSPTVNAYLQLANSSSDQGYLGYQSSDMTFYTAAAERMRIDSSGNLLVGKTASNFANAGVEIRGAGEITLTRAGDLLTTRRVTSEGVHISIRAIGGTVVGSVSSNGTNASFNTSSDYRLKENVVNITDGITRVKQLQPKRFNVIVDAETTVDGFLAHEAQTVVPEAVTGIKDEVDENGDPVMQGIDQSKLVPLLTAALQEAIAKIETLEQRLTDAGL